MQRPLPPTLLRYAAHDIVIMARLYAHFCQSPGAYFGDVPALRAMSTRYMAAYPARGLRAHHVPLGLGRFVPLDVLEAPRADERGFACGRCGWILAGKWFRVERADAGERRWLFCKLCVLLARRDGEAFQGAWVGVGGVWPGPGLY